MQERAKESCKAEDTPGFPQLSSVIPRAAENG